jgi:hypothetical protein
MANSNTSRPIAARPAPAKSAALVLCCTLLTGVLISCGLIPDLVIEDPDEVSVEQVQIIRVTQLGQPLDNAAVLFFSNTETAPDTLHTTSSGEIRINTEEWEYPAAIFVLEPGYTIGYLSGEAVQADTLNFNLSPATPREVRVIVSNNYASAAVDIAMSVDGYPLGSFYSGEETAAMVPYGIPQNMTAIIEFNSPPGIADVTVNPSNTSTIVQSDVAGYLLHRLLPYLTNEPLPAGYKLARGTGSEAPVKSDGFIWLPDSNQPEITLTLHGEQVGVYKPSDVHKWLSAFVPVWPVLHPEVNYQPLFQVNTGDIWEFDGAIRTAGGGGITTATDYVLKWTFEQVQATPTGLRYIIKEEVQGEQTGSHIAPRAVEAVSEVIIDEDGRGIWTYAASSFYSPTLHDANWLIQNPTHNINWEQVIVTRSDGSEYKTGHGKPGRMVPAGVVSYRFGDDLFIADQGGIRTTFRRSPPSNNVSSKRLTRMDSL